MLKNLWQWFAKEVINQKSLTKNKKREVFIKYFIRLEHPNWAEEKVDNFYNTTSQEKLWRYMKYGD